MRGPRRFLVVLGMLAALLLASCDGSKDVSGTYEGTGSGTLRRGTQPAQSFTMAAAPLIVKTVSRHYQFSEIEVTLGGCVLRSTGPGGEADAVVGGSAWSLGTAEHASCTLDIPSVGAVTLSLHGSLLRERQPKRSPFASENTNVKLSLSGSGTKEEMAFDYRVEARRLER